MKNFKYLLIAGISFFLFSCGDNTENETPTSEISHEEHSHNSEAIELDNGEKWVVIPEMMEHIKTMENDVKLFEDEKGTDFGTLATKLDTSISLLTSSCTMEGKAHDELHKWLVPYIEMVGELSEAETMDEKTEKFKEIQSSLVSFNTYFK